MDALQPRLLRLALENPRWTGLYYLLADRSYDREMHGVLHGRTAHVDAASGARADAVRFRLRRNVHRLEKGLLMVPRRSTFAEDYAEETADAFAAVVETSGVDADGTGPGRLDPLLGWADDVLKEYFSVTVATPPLARAWATYAAARDRVPAAARLTTEDASGEPAARRIPYRRDTGDLTVDLPALAQLAHRRRSVRWFRPDPVPREVVDRAVEVALQSPSACNRQPYTFYVFDEPEMVRRVVGIPIGTRGYAHNVPVVVVVVGRQRAYAGECDRHIIYVDGALAAMTFMYALEVQGVGSCPINWPDVESRERDMAGLLGLAADERPVLLMALGYPDPDGLVAFSQKLAVDDAARWNHLGGDGRSG